MQMENDSEKMKMKNASEATQVASEAWQVAKEA